jgi:hypothetical protein
MCAAIVLADIIRRPLPMPVMNWVWPITALYAGPHALWAYRRLGRAPQRPFWASVAVGATHCGAGCTLGDIMIAGSMLFAQYVGDCGIHFHKTFWAVRCDARREAPRCIHTVCFTSLAAGYAPSMALHRPADRLRDLVSDELVADPAWNQGGDVEIARMTVSQIVAFVLGNWFFPLFIVAIGTTIGKLRRAHREGRPVEAGYVAWGELLFYVVGLGYLYTGLLHAYAQAVVAPSIGWTPSPFEFELGWMEIPLGVVALASLWRGFEFRLAVTIVFSTFALACAAQHIQQMMCCGNYAPSNAGPVLWFADIVVPVLVVLLAAVAAARNART